MLVGLRDFTTSSSVAVTKVLITCVVAVVSLNAIMSVGNVCFLFTGYACTLRCEPPGLLAI
jgi:hypothetical protein